AGAAEADFASVFADSPWVGCAAAFGAYQTSIAYRVVRVGESVTAFLPVTTVPVPNLPPDSTTFCPVKYHLSVTGWPSVTGLREVAISPDAPSNRGRLNPCSRVISFVARQCMSEAPYCVG